MNDFLNKREESTHSGQRDKAITIEAVMVNLSDLSVIFDFYYKLCNEQLEKMDELNPSGVQLKFDHDFIKFVSDDYDINQPDKIFARRLEQDTKVLGESEVQPIFQNPILDKDNFYLYEKTINILFIQDEVTSDLLKNKKRKEPILEAHIKELLKSNLPDLNMSRHLIEDKNDLGQIIHVL